MTRLFFSLLLILSVSAINAQTVSTEKARKVAQTYLSINVSPDAALNLSANPLYTYADIDNTPIVYAYNVGNYGFILVGADESFVPVVGYSLNGAFNVNSIPPNLAAWVDGYIEDVYAVKHSQAKSGEILADQKKFRAEWMALDHGDAEFYTTKDSKSVDSLVLTKWDQGYGYNDFCPTYSAGDNGHSVTGCVATAMAQIIRYHRYPAVGFYNHGYGHSTYGYLEVDYDSAYYDYTLMPNKITYYSSAAQRRAVAQLSYHCGVAVNMNYQNPNHTSGSGAQSNKVPDGLKFFGYFNAFYKIKSSASSSQWDSLLRHDIDLSRPVYYSGTNSDDGGHAFVCDGYHNDGKYHFNFGWGGYGNGFYSLSSVNGYANSQAAVFNIVPSELGPMQDLYYIAADGVGGGSSWSDANPNLEAALEVCNMYSRGQIWVKSGTYYGDTNASNAFTIDKNVRVYGGFAGNENSIDDRSRQTAPSVMSGQNKRMVLYAPVLSKDSYIYDMTFADGLASNGSGVSMSKGLNLEYCIVENNSSTSANGAALLLNTGTVHRCIIRNNHCGGVDVGSYSVKNCLVVHNDGYGVKSAGGTIDGCDIVCNSGVGVRNDANTRIRNTIIWRNDSSLVSNDIKKISFCAIEGFADIDSNSNHGLSRENRPVNGFGPFFIDPDTTCGVSANMGDWHLSSLSPLVDAGDTNHNGAYYYDLDGEGRFRNGQPDIGCYEWIPGNSIILPDATSSVKVYPNPADATLCIEAAAGTVQIFDAMGRIVLSTDTCERTVRLDISSLPHGIYLLRIGNSTAKIIKK